MAKASHTWTFFRAGGVDQVVLRSGEDLAQLGSLDQKLWVALACPVKGTEIEERMLDLVDTDRDGRVRPPEVIEAIEWSTKVFGKLDSFLEPATKISLGQLDKNTEEGKSVHASAKRILKEIGKKEEKEISLDDVLSMEKAFSSTHFNGDGIVPADSASDDATRAAIEEIIGAVGSAQDRSGKPGVDEKLVTQFFAEAAAAIAWEKDGEVEGVQPVGAPTAAAAAAVTAIEAKLDDYFARCDLAAFDARAASAMSAAEAELVALSQKTLATSDPDIKKLPLAKIEAGRALPLGTSSINPAWAGAVAALAADAITPVLGARTALSAADWATLKSKLGAHREWSAKKPTTKTATLGGARLAELAEKEKTILELIAKDAALAPEFAAIGLVEKAVRYRSQLARLARNFVNFSDFYNGRGASFQAGRLFLDARTCDLVVYVNDAGKHAALAGLSSAYLAYLDITRPGADKRGIVAAFTAGDVDNLMVGRNGVFYDRAGRDWDATITSIIENPISVRQAFWSPYKRLVRLIEEQIAKRAAEKEKESSGKIDALATKAANVDAQAAAPAPAPGAPGAPGAPAPIEPPKSKFDPGTLAAIGLVVTGIAGFFTATISMFLGLGVWLPFGILGILLAISGPSMLIAWIKLRKRSLGPILDANGWAVNNRAKINVPFGVTLTHLARLPEGASRTLDDPYADQPVKWKRWVALAILVLAAVLWFAGTLDKWLPDSAKSSKVLNRTAASASAAPSAAPPPPAAPAAPPSAPK